MDRALSSKIEREYIYYQVHGNVKQEKREATISSSVMRVRVEGSPDGRFPRLEREARRMMAGLSYHYYIVPGGWANKNSATEFGEPEWLETLQKALFMDELLRKHSTIMDRYDPEKRVGLIVDEWGTWYAVEPGTNPSFLFQQNSLRDALVAGVVLNIFNQHCDRVKMANLAQTVNVLQSVILTEEGKITVLLPSKAVAVLEVEVE